MDYYAIDRKNKIQLTTKSFTVFFNRNLSSQEEEIMKKHLYATVFYAFLLFLAKSSNAEELTAKALYGVFDNNEIAAEARYKGNNIIITGIVKDIKKNVGGQPIVNLDAGSLKFVTCRFPKESIEQLVRIKKGDQLRFSCTVEYKILTTIHLSNCSIL